MISGNRLFRAAWLHSLARKRRGYSQSAGRSNTISRVVPRSRTDFLSNYRHNHIWLLITCVLVSFQKVPEPVAGASSLPPWLREMRRIQSCELFFFLCVFSFSVILFSLFFSPLLQVLFYCYYQMFLFFPHLFIIFFLSSRWQRRCFYRPAIKAATAESEKDSAPMLFPVIYSYYPQKHTGFKPLNIQISRRPLCLSLLHSKILINCFVCGSSYYRPPYRLRRPRSLNKQEKVFRKCSQCGLFFCSAGGD